MSANSLSKNALYSFCILLDITPLGISQSSRSGLLPVFSLTCASSMYFTDISRVSTNRPGRPVTFSSRTYSASGAVRFKPLKLSYSPTFTNCVAPVTVMSDVSEPNARMRSTILFGAKSICKGRAPPSKSLPPKATISETFCTFGSSSFTPLNAAILLTNSRFGYVIWCGSFFLLNSNAACAWISLTAFI